MINFLNIEFQEEYKKLDKICKEIFSSEKGVSRYIEEMEKTPLSQQRLVAFWHKDYQMLKHLRWKRNQLAHSIEIGENFCCKEDIENVKSFYNRILNAQDPFGQLEKIQSKKLTPQPKKTKVVIKVKRNDNKTFGQRILSFFKKMF